MENTKAQFEITEFEAFALSKHYRKMAEECREKGLMSLVEEYYLRADKWIEIAIEITESKENALEYFSDETPNWMK